MRKAPTTSPGELPGLASDNVIEETRTYRFLTYVFGGGVEPEKFDSVTPIRGASIRGQLRFWWRACNPRRCQTVDELRKAEEKVFGSSSEASPLLVSVTQQPSKPKAIEVFEKKFNTVEGMGDIGYGAFPLRSTDLGQEPHGRLFKFDSPWEVRLRYPTEIRTDVRAALWAWAHFGGLGARTRRGFGAIAQTEPKLEGIDAGWDKYVAGLAVDWPHLPNRSKRVFSRVTETGDGFAAHEQVLKTMWRLRQGDLGRKGRKRSYWPEPDAIRSLTRQSLPQHRRPVTNHNDKFPRAAFGLPIIFHFKDDKHGEPDQTTLKPENNDRMASPLIIRPHRNSSDDYGALALKLVGPFPRDVVLETNAGRGTRKYQVETRLSEPEARNLGIEGRPSPLVVGEKVFKDPIQRFIAELEKTGR